MTVIALMKEAARTSETSVNFYQTTRRNIPEDSNLHTRRCENLKSYLVNRVFVSIINRVNGSRNADSEISREVANPYYRNARFKTQTRVKVKMASAPKYDRRKQILDCTNDHQECKKILK
jgi:hypothetical protein